MQLIHPSEVIPRTFLWVLIGRHCEKYFSCFVWNHLDKNPGLFLKKERFLSLVISSTHVFFWQSSRSRFFTMTSENYWVEVNSLKLWDYFSFILMWEYIYLYVYIDMFSEMSFYKANFPHCSRQHYYCFSSAQERQMVVRSNESMRGRKRFYVAAQNRHQIEYSHASVLFLMAR